MALRFLGLHAPPLALHTFLSIACSSPILPSCTALSSSKRPSRSLPSLDLPIVEYIPPMVYFLCSQATTEFRLSRTKISHYRDIVDPPRAICSEGQMHLLYGALYIHRYFLLCTLMLFISQAFFVITETPDIRYIKIPFSDLSTDRPELLVISDRTRSTCDSLIPLLSAFKPQLFVKRMCHIINLIIKRLINVWNLCNPAPRSVIELYFHPLTGEHQIFYVTPEFDVSTQYQLEFRLLHTEISHFRDIVEPALVICGEGQLEFRLLHTEISHFRDIVEPALAICGEGQVRLIYVGGNKKQLEVLS
ncbi:hypothetical protein KSP40_PGU011686 [Platanthera guangdongensis]|uniref:Uncharacterized protein n=1 Tax=Platanthera guangdongensis TaxID=2320717 RepID=A0ABR2LRK1_9ASPA